MALARTTKKEEQRQEEEIQKEIEIIKKEEQKRQGQKSKESRHYELTGYWVQIGDLYNMEESFNDFFKRLDQTNYNQNEKTILM